MGTEQSEKGEAGIFVLRGVWQFIPQCRRPVFTIYRNELKDYENRPSNQHLPLIWTDQPPYRFRKDSEEKPKFYQITARLIPQRACFGFVSQIADPQDFTPRRVKKPQWMGRVLLLLLKVLRVLRLQKNLGQSLRKILLSKLKLLQPLSRYPKSLILILLVDF